MPPIFVCTGRRHVSPSVCVNGRPRPHRVNQACPAMLLLPLFLLLQHTLPSLPYQHSARPVQPHFSITTLRFRLRLGTRLEVSYSALDARSLGATCTTALLPVTKIQMHMRNNRRNEGCSASNPIMSHDATGSPQQLFAAHQDVAEIAAPPHTAQLHALHTCRPNANLTPPSAAPPAMPMRNALRAQGTLGSSERSREGEMVCVRGREE